MKNFFKINRALVAKKKFFTLTLALMATITLWAQEFTFTGSTLPSGWTGTETGSRVSGALFFSVAGSPFFAGLT